ncbi:MAG: hypothetical protein ACYC7C_11945 [Coriobacteriia bacterium]
METVVAVAIAGVILYFKFRPKVDAIIKGVQQAPAGSGSEVAERGSSGLLVLGTLLTLANGATLLTGGTHSSNAGVYWVGFFGGLALLYRGFTIKVPRSVSNARGDAVGGVTESAIVNTPAPREEVLRSLQPWAVASVPEQPGVDEFGDLKGRIDDLKQALRRGGEPYPALELYDLGRLYALLYDHTGESGHRASAFKYMTAASQADPDLFDPFLGSGGLRPFGSLVADPQFESFA